MTTKAQTLSAANNKQRNQMIIVGIVVVAVIAVLAVILLSNGASSANIQFDDIPQTRLDDGGFVLGNPEAPVTIVEFADYGCPHCQQYKPTIDRFIEEYVRTGKARYELRIFPTAGGQLTYFIGQVAACLENQQPGAFWAAGELFYQKAMRGQYNDNTARTVTQEMGLDYGAALECARTQDQVQTDIDLGSQLGVRGTPTVLARIGNRAPTIIGESYNDLVAAVEVGSLTQ